LTIFSATFNIVFAALNGQLDGWMNMDGWTYVINSPTFYMLNTNFLAQYKFRAGTCEDDSGNGSLVRRVISPNF